MRAADPPQGDRPHTGLGDRSPGGAGQPIGVLGDAELRDRQHTAVREAGCTQRVMICEGLLALLAAATVDRGFSAVEPRSRGLGRV